MPFIQCSKDLRAAVRTGEYAWPGGYPIYYLTADGESFCPPCVRKEYRYVLREVRHPSEHDEWRVVGYDVNWDDDSMYCAHCDIKIEAAYGGFDAVETSDIPDTSDTSEVNEV